MNELVAALVTGGVSIVGAVVALIVSWLNTKRIRGEMDSLRREIDAGGGRYYILCPSCGAKVFLRGDAVKVDTDQPDEA